MKSSSRWRLFWSLCLLCSVFVNSNYASDQPAATLDASEICNVLNSMFRDVDELRVVYSVPYANASETLNSHVVSEVALRAPSSIYCKLTHVSDLVPGRDDPFHVHIHCDGETVCSANDFFRMYTQDRVDTAASAKIIGDNMGIYVIAMGIWPLQLSWPRPGLAHLGEITPSSGYTTVSAKQERLGTHWCHLLSNADSSDRIWLDTDELVVRRRQRFTPERYLYSQTDFSDFQSPDGSTLRLPQRVLTTKYDPFAETDELRKKVTSHKEIVVQELSLHLSDDISFRYAPPQGSLRKATADTYEQVRPGREVVCDDIANWVRKYGRDVFNASYNSPEKSSVGLETIVLVVVNVLLGAAYACSVRRARSVRGTGS